MSALEVLVVEDEPLIAMLLAELLGEMGHAVCATESTQAGAVAAALRCRPGLMIVDAGLTQGSGIAAVSEILLDRFVPHVFVTGSNLSPADLNSNAVVLRKPFRNSDLEVAIRRARAEPAA